MTHSIQRPHCLALVGVMVCLAGLGRVARSNDAPATVPGDAKILERARTAWAFQPLNRGLIPPALDPAWKGEANGVDGFLRTALKARGLEPNPPASPRDLLRRVHFDLVGLPPTPDEVRAFEANPSFEHYRRVIDDLLSRPQYGERWARHWLDLARYTESTGFEYDRLRDHAWPYRDYVIRAFHEDKPYDRFMMEQIAGDVLEPVTRDGIIATSLLVCGAYDQAGNNQANVTQRTITREEELEDLLSVVGQTFLGLTVNCARCHEHKFDPIPLTDYYRIKSVFDGVYHADRPLETPAEAREREAAIVALKRVIAEAEGEAERVMAEGWRLAKAQRVPVVPDLAPRPWLRWDFRSSTSEGLGGTLEGGAVIRDGALMLPAAGAFFSSPVLSRDLREKTLEAWVSLTNLSQRGGAAIAVQTPDGKEFDAIVFGERQARKWAAGSEGFQRTHDLDAPEENATSGKWIHMAVSYGSDGTIAVYRNGEPYGQPYRVSGGLKKFSAGKAKVVLGLRHTGGGTPWLTGAIRRAALHDRALTAEEVRATYQSMGYDASDSEILAALDPERRAAREAALLRASKARDGLSVVEKTKLVYAGRRQQPAPTQRFRRGDVKSPDGVVAPGALSALVPILGEWNLPPDVPEAERRIRFARWLADPKNPLPARVMANRVWHYHFGQGLVSTPSDFGAGGVAPTHPELLDWLATQFIDSGWSLKSLHRLIVTSAAYRQSSAYQEKSAAVDADNALVWRFAPRRLEAETLRDAMLAVSGRLNPQVGGPSFRPFTTTDFNATFYHPFDRDEPDFNRRTVYRMNVNSGKEPLLDAFDCPDPSVKTPRRVATTTPLQALGLMNGTFTLRQARLLAERAEASAPGDRSAQLRWAYRLAFGRPPTDAETERGLAAAKDRGLASVCWVLLNSTEFFYVR